MSGVNYLKSQQKAAKGINKKANVTIGMSESGLFEYS